MTPGLDVPLAGTTVRLLPERALLWPEEATLLVADLHLDKAEAFRRAGRPMPHAAARADLDALAALAVQHRAERVVVLGDLYHAPGGSQAPATRDALADWRQRHPELLLALVPGNHDRRAGLPPSDLGIEVWEAGHRLGPFALYHEPPEEGEGYALAGHVHPGVVLQGPGGDRLRLPAFRFGEGGGILPAFGALTGLMTEPPRPGERVFVAAEDEVIQVAGAR